MLGVNIGFCCHKSLEAKGEKCISRPILRISLYPREAKEMKEALLTLEFSTLWNAVVCSGCWSAENYLYFKALIYRSPHKELKMALNYL